MQLVQGSLFAGDVEVVRATLLRLREQPVEFATEPVGGTDRPLPPPGAAQQLGGNWTIGTGFWNAVESSRVRGRVGRPRAGRDVAAAAGADRGRRRAHSVPTGRGRGRLRQRRGGRVRPAALLVHQSRPHHHPAPAADEPVGGARLARRSRSGRGSGSPRACSTTSRAASGGPSRPCSSRSSDPISKEAAGLEGLAAARVRALAVVGLVAPRAQLALRGLLAHAFPPEKPTSVVEAVRDADGDRSSAGSEPPGRGQRLPVACERWNVSASSASPTAASRACSTR